MGRTGYEIWDLGGNWVVSITSFPVPPKILSSDALILLVRDMVLQTCRRCLIIRTFEFIQRAFFILTTNIVGSRPHCHNFFLVFSQFSWFLPSSASFSLAILAFSFPYCSSSFYPCFPGFSIIFLLVLKFSWFFSSFPGSSPSSFASVFKVFLGFVKFS